MMCKIAFLLFCLACTGRGWGVQNSQLAEEHEGSVKSHALSTEERVTLCMGGSLKQGSHDEHSNDEEDHDDHDHDHHYDTYDYLMGVMLIAGMILIAFIKLLLNFKNYHVREVTWVLLDGSVSIFLAVFTWNVFRAFLTDLIGEDMESQVIVWRICAVLFYGLMFLILSSEARLGYGIKTRQDIAHDPNKMHEVTNYMHTVTFLAHAAAFSSMTGWSLTLNHESRKDTVQHASYCVFSWWWKVVVYLAALELLRLLIIKYLLQTPGHQHDHLVEGHPGNDHAGHDHLVEHWVELLKEGEDDLFSLVMSFLVSAVIVFFIVGEQVIETSGHEGLQTLCSHNVADVRYAFFYSFLFLVSAFVYGVMRIKGKPGLDAGEEIANSMNIRTSYGQVTYGQRFIMASQFVLNSGREFASMTGTRVSASLESTLIMTFAWLFIYASQWLVAISTVFNHPLAGGNRTCLNLLVALICMAFAGIFIILVAYISKKLEKWHRGPAAVIVSKALKHLMKGMGFLIGFTWEQAFNHAIGAIANHAEEFTDGKLCDAHVKLALFFMTVCVIYPTWSWYIVPQSTEKGFLFGFVPRNTAEFVRQVLKRDDVDLTREQKVEYLEAALAQLRKEMTLPEERPTYSAPNLSH